MGAQHPPFLQLKMSLSQHSKLHGRNTIGALHRQSVSQNDLDKGAIALQQPCKRMSGSMLSLQIQALRLLVAAGTDAAEVAFHESYRKGVVMSLMKRAWP